MYILGSGWAYLSEIIISLPSGGEQKSDDQVVGTRGVPCIL